MATDLTLLFSMQDRAISGDKTNFKEAWGRNSATREQAKLFATYCCQKTVPAECGNSPPHPI